MTRAALLSIFVMQIVIGSIMYVYATDEIKAELELLKENAEVIKTYKE